MDRAVSGPALALYGAGSGDRKSCWGAACTGASRSGSSQFGLGEPSWASNATGARGCRVFSRWDTSTTLRGSEVHQCVRYRCLPGWHGRQQLWGLLLCRGWVMLRGSSTRSETPRHPVPILHSPWARSRQADGLARGCPTPVKHPGARRPLAQQRLTPRGCCLQPALAETLFLHLHNAELALRWEGRSWDTRQGAGTWSTWGAVNLPS